MQKAIFVLLLETQSEQLDCVRRQRMGPLARSIYVRAAWLPYLIEYYKQSTKLRLILAKLTRSMAVCKIVSSIFLEIGCI